MSLFSSPPPEAEVEFTQQLQAIVAAGFDGFLNITAHDRAELRAVRSETLKQFGVLLGALLGLVWTLANDWYGLATVVAVGSVFLIVDIIKRVRVWLAAEQTFARRIHQALQPFLEKLLDCSVRVRSLEETGKTIEERLSESQLYTSKYDEIKGDDVFVISGPHGHSLEAAELSLSEQRGSGKNRHMVEVFRGLLVKTRLSTSYHADTFISTDGDRYGFAHQTFWSGLLKADNVDVTELESNDFERDLHVATTNGRAAREVLTPDFMEELHTWWQEHSLNIRLAFLHDTLYLLLPEPKTKFGFATTSTNRAAVETYVQSIARPLWRTLRLLEKL